MKARKIIGLFGITMFSAIIAVVIYARIIQPQTRYVQVEAQPIVREVSYKAESTLQAMDFTGAAEATVHSVVHVMTTAYRKVNANPVYELFFGEAPKRPLLSFGSGVIISQDGYIVTNNHVIQDSEEIEVTLNDRRTYKAKLVGGDSLTDIALLKIKENNLSTLTFGNSDDLRLGEWVLAVGNPYNLTSTVTAGIVSAKARDIRLMGDSPLSIESYIQTDAAVNQGNSGGALVNTRGELVGINTAIASRTGNYTGYSFAIPVSIVKKVVADLREFGEVQRAVLGISISNIDTKLIEKEDLEDTEGVYISDLADNGAAREAGMKIGDIILSINDIKVNTVTELQEQVSKYRPNDLVKVILKRKGELKQFDVVLRNLEGSTEIVSNNNIIEGVGASFEPLSSAEKEMLGIKNGVRVASVKSGKFKEVGIKAGYIVIYINKKPVNDVKDISDVLLEVDGGVLVEGIYENGKTARYVFGME